MCTRPDDAAQALTDVRFDHVERIDLALGAGSDTGLAVTGQIHPVSVLRVTANMTSDR